MIFEKCKFYFSSSIQKVVFKECHFDKMIEQLVIKEDFFHEKFFDYFYHNFEFTGNNEDFD